MPKLAPFILPATFLTHDNNFHLYLSRSVKKEHYITARPREAAGYLGQGVRAHLRGWPRRAGGHLSGQAARSPVPPRSCGSPRPGRAGNGAAPWVAEGGGRWRLLVRGATLTSGDEAEGSAASGGTPRLFHLAASPPPLEGISKITTLMFEITVFLGVKIKVDGEA